MMDKTGIQTHEAPYIFIQVLYQLSYLASGI